MTYWKRRIVAVKWLKLAEIILPLQSFRIQELCWSSLSLGRVPFLLPAHSKYSQLLFLILDRKDMLRGENFFFKKRQLSHTELKKVNIGSFVFFVNLVQQNWFNFSKYNRLENAQCRENTHMGKSLPWTNPAALRKRGIFLPWQLFHWRNQLL